VILREIDFLLKICW